MSNHNSCGLCSISKAVRINRLEQDGIIALGYALLNLADLGSSVLISAQDGQVNAQLVSLGLSSLGYGNLECVGLVLLDEGDLVGIAARISTGIGACIRTGGSTAAGSQTQSHGTGKQHSEKSLLCHFLFPP